MAARPYTVRAVQSPQDRKWRVKMFAGNGKVIVAGEHAYAHKYNADREAVKLASVSVVHAPPKALRK